MRTARDWPPSHKPSAPDRPNDLGLRRVSCGHKGTRWQRLCGLGHKTLPSAESCSTNGHQMELRGGPEQRYLKAPMGGICAAPRNLTCPPIREQWQLQKLSSW